MTENRASGINPFFDLFAGFGIPYTDPQRFLGGFHGTFCRAASVPERILRSYFQLVVTVQCKVCKAEFPAFVRLNRWHLLSKKLKKAEITKFF